jgi:class 3 adenylate cyclase
MMPYASLPPCPLPGLLRDAAPATPAAIWPGPHMTQPVGHAALPTGRVTLLFSDIEGSTRLLQRLGGAVYASVLGAQRRLLRTTFRAWHGHEVDAAGDGCFAVFAHARFAAAAAVAAQQALAAHPWPEGIQVRVRMGLHTGEPALFEEGYVGLDVHRAARICAAARGGQILLSEATHALVVPELPGGVHLRDAGPHWLKDLDGPEPLFELQAAGLPCEEPRAGATGRFARHAA